ncbi:MAG TPA: hypothetical protein VD971_04495 [Phycisphaerales bacterium]|nr:hypothetical protein [Phycisphaerales bacterium]
MAFRRRSPAAFVASACALGTAALAGPSDPWADEVMSFNAGAGANPAHPNPNASLGSPERFTGEGVFPGTVTPFASAYGGNEIVSIGAGGSLVVRFDEPVRNDPGNPYGIDLIVFGNTFFYDPSFEPIATALWEPGGRIEVSADGADWELAPGVNADGLFPTLGYTDEASPFGSAAPGQVPTDFTKPVNPAFAWQGQDLAGLIAGYDGSGGGAGVDIGALGFSEISYVRVSLPAGTPGKFEIDAFSDVTAVPSPGMLVLAAVGGFFSLRRSPSRRSVGAP